MITEFSFSIKLAIFTLSWWTVRAFFSSPAVCFLFHTPLAIWQIVLHFHAMSTPPSQLHSGQSSSVCLLSCARSIPWGFHLLAPSKALHTGGVIAQLTAGEGVGEAEERNPSMNCMQGHCGLDC